MKPEFVTRAILLLFLVLLLGTWVVLNWIHAPERFKSPEKLTVLTIYSPTVFYEGPEGLAGFEYELFSHLATYLGKELDVRVAQNLQEVLERMEAGEADLASAGIVRTDVLEKQYVFSPPYYQVRPMVVCQKGIKIPKNPEELANYSIEIVKSRNYEAHLQTIDNQYPDLNLTWLTSTSFDVEQLLERVSKGEVDCTVADNNIVAVNRRTLLNLVEAFPLADQQDIAWIVASRNKHLQRVLDDWFGQERQERLLSHLKYKYYANTHFYDHFDTVKFHERIRTRLPRYEDLFKQAAEKYDLPWRLLAAQSYQESHWYSKARSPTGVRGLMMLTRETSRRLGVTNRINPRQSIFGGARYLRMLLKEVPDEVNFEDRIYFALAAYNVGMGHVTDAMMLAEKQGKDPHRWQEVAEVLPLLSRRKYYRQLPHGYARGREPVTYVGNIVNYLNILDAIYLTEK